MDTADKVRFCGADPDDELTEAEAQATLDDYFAALEHEGKCPQDVEIRISTYPGSERIMRICVCAECRHRYLEIPPAESDLPF